jgi:hypothetical protein
MTSDSLHDMMDSRPFKMVYGVALPLLVIILLLGVASLNSRPHILGSAASDLIIRFLFAIWFSILYIRLSRISTFSSFPNKKWTKADVGALEKHIYWGLSIFFGVVCGIIITWSVIQWFLPSLSSFAYVISTANSLMIIIPLITHYWVLKL